MVVKSPTNSFVLFLSVQALHTQEAQNLYQLKSSLSNLTSLNFKKLFTITEEIWV